MKQTLIKLAASCLAVMPTCCLAAEAAAPATMTAAQAAVRDVALARGGLLEGQVVNAQGAVMKGTPVSVWFENRQVATVVTDEQGQFSIGGLRGGVHKVVAGQGGEVYRLWTAEAAPPGAQSNAVVIPGEAVIRGQNGMPIKPFIQSPILWGAIGYTAGHIIGFNAGIDRSPSSP